MHLLNHALRVWARHRAFRAVFAELARLSERALRDMGIDRGDIARIAYQEAERRIPTPAPSRTPAASGQSPDPVLAG